MGGFQVSVYSQIQKKREENPKRYNWTVLAQSLKSIITTNPPREHLGSRIITIFLPQEPRWLGYQMLTYLVSLTTYLIDCSS